MCTRRVTKNTQNTVLFHHLDKLSLIRTTRDIYTEQHKSVPYQIMQKQCQHARKGKE